MANKKVILCSGGIADPAILQRSGIGDAAVLSPLGIPTVVHNPNVGLNLQAHYGPCYVQIPATFGPPGPPPFTGMMIFSDLSGANIGVATGVRNMQMICFPGVDDMGNLRVDSFNFIMRPTKNGSVQIVSTDPNVDPVVEFKPYDAQGRSDAVKCLKAWWNISMAYTGAPPILPPQNLYPAAFGGPQPDDVALETYAMRNNLMTNHASGSCKMAIDATTGVVDGDLNVFGCTGLSVCSNAIQPTIITGNTQVPAYLIGLIKAKIEGAATPY
jgi:choline dehydrogenase